jgi:hypothetical protein
METAFRALLTGSSAVTALVPAAQINWGAHPQGAPLPGVVLNVIFDAEGLVMNGPDGVSGGRVQVDCYGGTFAQARGVAAAIRALLHAHVGNGFLLITHESSRTGREGGSNEAERPFRFSMDFNTKWRAS